MKVELSDNELKLIKEALKDNSTKYAYNASVMKDIDSYYSADAKEKSDNMTELLNKLNKIEK